MWHQNPPPVLPDESSSRREDILFYVNRKWVYISAVPLQHEDVGLIVTEREAGCDGRGRAARRVAGSCTVKPCGPVPPMQGTSLRGYSQATVANAGSPRRARSSRKAIAQGVPE